MPESSTSARSSRILSTRAPARRVAPKTAAAIRDIPPDRPAYAPLLRYDAERPMDGAQRLRLHHRQPHAARAPQPTSSTRVATRRSARACRHERSDAGRSPSRPASNPQNPAGVARTTGWSWPQPRQPPPLPASPPERRRQRPSRSTLQPALPAHISTRLTPAPTAAARAGGSARPTTGRRSSVPAISRTPADTTAVTLTSRRLRRPSADARSGRASGVGLTSRRLPHRPGEASTRSRVIPLPGCASAGREAGSVRCAIGRRLP
jgi:hypothetical protein